MSLKPLFKRVFVLAVVLLSLTHNAFADSKLSGTPIGTPTGWSYESNKTQSNMFNNLFDGNLTTYFASKDASYTWAGLDLGSQFVITKVGWAPRAATNGPQRMVLGVFQGANSPDFLDAVPLFMILDKPQTGAISYGSVDCSRGFRYVRYVSPSGAQCNVAELEFYGHAGAGNDSKLFQPSNLPTVLINTVNSQEPVDKETDITSNFIILNNNTVDTDKPGTVRERGNGSRTFPKKPWRIKFDKKQNILDAPAKAKKWTLINNYGDKTLMRNLLAFDIAKRLKMKYVPYARPVDVFLNGEYKGTYQLCDQIEINPNRLDITEMEATDISGENLTGGYLYELDAYAYEEPEGEWFYSSRSIPVTIKSPDAGGTTEQYNYLKNYFNNFETRLFASNFMDPVNGYRAVFDNDSFLRHFIVGELSANTDTYWSVYQYKERNDPKIYTGPVWDFDLAFENDSRTYPVNNINGYLYNSNRASAANGVRNFVNRIIVSDTGSAAEISKIWSLARNDNGLNAENLCALADSLAIELSESQKLNFLRWPILNQLVHMNPRILGSFEAEVEGVKTFLKARFPKLDQLMKYDATMTETSVEGVADSKNLMARIRIDSNCIALDGETVFSVYSVAGALIHNSAETTTALPSGIYIVIVSNQRIKIAL